MCPCGTVESVGGTFAAKDGVLSEHLLLCPEGGEGRPDSISRGASGSGSLCCPVLRRRRRDKPCQSQTPISSKRGKSHLSTSSIVLIFFFSPHLLVTVGIVTAIFNQLSSLVVGKGVSSSRAFAEFSRELLGLIRETPETCSGCVVALLPASAEGPGGDRSGTVRRPGGSGQVCFFPCLVSVGSCSSQMRHEAAVRGVAVTGAGRGRSRAESEPGRGEMKLVVI